MGLDVKETIVLNRCGKLFELILDQKCSQRRGAETRRKAERRKAERRKTAEGNGRPRERSGVAGTKTCMGTGWRGGILPRILL
jgi:hypothetical protein